MSGTASNPFLSERGKGESDEEREGPELDQKRRWRKDDNGEEKLDGMGNAE